MNETRCATAGFIFLRCGTTPNAFIVELAQSFEREAQPYPSLAVPLRSKTAKLGGASAARHPEGGRLLPKGRKNSNGLDCIRLARVLPPELQSNSKAYGNKHHPHRSTGRRPHCGGAGTCGRHHLPAVAAQ